MKLRNFVRISSVTAFALAALIAVTVINTKHMNTYKQQLEVSYRQSLSELNESLDLINTDLTKSLYSNSDAELLKISRDLYAECAAAKNAVSRLPVTQTELSNVYKFLSQASDYAQFIGSKIERGETVSTNEHQTLKVLLKYANQLEKSTSNSVRIVEGGAKITDSDLKLADTKVTPVSNSFSQSVKSFESYPTLLYDGPFSEQVLNKDSALLKSAGEKSKNECKKIAADAIGKSEKRVIFDSESKGRLPAYTFKSGRYTVAVTKRGGYVKSILYSGKITESNISESNASELAKSLLDGLGYKNMEQSYYSVNDNVCTVNFAYKDKDIYYYSDLIKVCVSMENGTVIALDASTYLTNHTKRSAFSAKIKEAAARKKISPYLEIKGVKKCVIPKDDGKETQCFEYTCTSRDTGEDALIYINAKTGKEEDIMLLLYSDNGTLVK